MDAEPPSAIGQPLWWAGAISAKASAVVNGRLSGRNECAALPASNAPASSVEK
jgi:hypothetical protein